jgi:hypothetical protein
MLTAGNTASFEAIGGVWKPMVLIAFPVPERVQTMSINGQAKLMYVVIIWDFRRKK